MIAVAATAGGLLIAAGSSAASPTPPPNPSQGQISAAQEHKNAVAARIGQLSGQILAAQNELSVLQGKAEMAEQNLAYAIQKQRSAEHAEQVARARVGSAARSVSVAHTKFVQYLQSSYMTGTSDLSTGTLLTAKDPSTLLQATTLEQYEAEDKVDAIGTLQTATVAKSNADSEAQLASLRAKHATATADHEKIAADQAVARQSEQEAGLKQTLSTSQTQLLAAQSSLATLNHEHVQFVAYVAHQRYLAEQARKRKLAEERQARLAHEREVARERLARQRARERERQHHHHGGSGGGNGNNGGGGTAPPPPPSSGGGWTPAKGRYAMHRALSELGVPYAWAGGGPTGPSYGVCDPGAGAPNDCHVDGFDCSGLALYAWGPYLSMAHYAKLQYSEAGSYHPSLSDLRPGDLIFYSLNGAVSGIHHVAIYKGNGEIIQAPYSGAYVEVSSMYDPGPIFGATRPLS